MDPKNYMKDGDSGEDDAEHERHSEDLDFSDGGELSSGGHSPRLLSQALERMKIIKPKFQPKYGREKE